MLARTGRLLARAARRLRADDAPTRAAALTFRTRLSVVPFLAVFFAVLTGFGPFVRTEARLESFLLEHLLPGTAQAAIAHLTRLTAKTTTVGAVDGEARPGPVEITVAAPATLPEGLGEARTP